MCIFPLYSKPKIFISYRRADNELPSKVIKQLYDALVNKFGKDNVLMDEDIPLGKDYRGVLKEWLSSCDILLVIIGPNWQITRLQGHEDWVRIEIETGLQRHIPVIPVIIDGATFDRSLLPNTINELNYRQQINLATDNLNKDIQKLISSIESYTNKNKVLAFLMTIILILFVGIVSLNSNRPDPVPTLTPPPSLTNTPIPLSTDTYTPTFEYTVTPELTQPSTSTTTETLISTPLSEQIEIMIQPGWLRIRTLSNEPISLEGLILLPINNLSRSGEPARDFSVLTGGRLAQPNNCYIYVANNSSVDYSGCEKSYDIVSLFWLDSNNQPATIEIYWNDALKELCNRICEV